MRLNVSEKKWELPVIIAVIGTLVTLLLPAI